MQVIQKDQDSPARSIGALLEEVNMEVNTAIRCYASQLEVGQHILEVQGSFQPRIGKLLSRFCKDMLLGRCPVPAEIKLLVEADENYLNFLEVHNPMGVNESYWKICT